MKQILKRISKIAKSYLIKDKQDEYYYDLEDYELKKIIEELNSKNQYKNFNRQKTDNTDFDKACLDLGINKNASIEEIKSAFRKKIKYYHPDTLNNLTDEERKFRLEKAKEIINAYEFFKRKYNF